MTTPADHKNISALMTYSIRYAIGKQFHVINEISQIISVYNNILTDDDKANLKTYIKHRVTHDTVAYDEWQKIITLL